MKKGLNAWAFPETMPMEKRMEVTQRAGFDGFEVLFEKQGFVGMNSSDADLKQVRTMADDLGIAIPSIVGTHYDSLTLTSGDPAEIREFTARFAKMLHAASLLGADTALLVAGRCESTKANPYGQYDVAYENAVRNVASLASIAREENVAIGVEPVWSKFLLSPLELRALIDHADSRWVGAYFDVGNVMIWGYPEQWIRILGKRILKVHFKDFRRSVGTGGGFVDLLAGDVDFPEVMAAFREIGYDDYATAEVSPYAFAPEQMAYQTATAMDAIFKM